MPDSSSKVSVASLNDETTLRILRTIATIQYDVAGILLQVFANMSEATAGAQSCGYDKPQLNT